MKTKFVNIACLAAALCFFAACGSQTNKAAFKDAAPELKQIWDQAVAADKSNDYLAANTNYFALLSREISSEQFVVVKSALGALNERMQAAAANGDAAAQKAIEDLKTLRGAPVRPNLPATP
jgi:hypothetical protein